MRAVVLALALTTGCAGYLLHDDPFRRVRLQAADEHQCPIEQVDFVGRTVSHTGVWLYVCGWDRLYVERPAGGWAEDLTRQREDTSTVGDGSGYAAPSGGGRVHVRGYYRQGRYVRSHTRSRPR